MPGKRYAWQVQAKSGNPVIGGNATDDNGVYKNNGLSEIFYFDYVEDCLVPSLLMAKNVGRGRTELRWSIAGSKPNALYSIQYRKRGGSGTWAQQESYQEMAILTGLEDVTEYEYRVGAACGNSIPSGEGRDGATYSYSAIQYFTTDSKENQNSNYQCGMIPQVDISNKSPLQSPLGVNEVFMAGDFPVTVLEAQGSSGTYSGTGFIQVPYLADTRLKVTFNGIGLNTDKKLISGVVETSYDVNETNVVQAREVLRVLEDVVNEVVGLFSKRKEFLDNYTNTPENRKKAVELNKAEDVVYDGLAQSPYLTAEEKRELKAEQVAKAEGYAGLAEGCGETENVPKKGPNVEINIYYDSNKCREKIAQATKIKEYADKAKEREKSLGLEQVADGYQLTKNSLLLSPANKLFELPANSIIHFYCIDYSFFVNGAIYGFTLPTGEYYVFRTSDIQLRNFSGYYRITEGKFGELYQNKSAIPSARQTVTYVHGLNNEATGKNEYQIIEDLTEVTDAQLNSKNLAGTTLDFEYNRNGQVLKTEFGKTSCKIKPQEKSTAPFEIKTAGRYTAKATFDKATNKWQVEVKLDVSLKQSDSLKKAADKNTAKIFEKQMSDLATDKLNELGGPNSGKTLASSEATEDAGEFYVKDMNGSEWVKTICDLGSNVWENATLPESYWNKDAEGYKSSTIHLPPTLAGVSDGAIDLVSDYPQLIKLGYDVATDAKVRTGIWTAIKNITPSSVLSMAEQGVKDKIAKYNFTDKPYLGYHEIGKDGVTVVSAIMGAAFISQADDALEDGVKNTGEKVKEAIEKKTIDLEKDMAEDWFKKRMSDAFERYKKKFTENFSEQELKELQNAYEQRFKTLYKNREIGKITEKIFQELEGGAPKVFKFQNEVRRVDNVLGTTAKEIKSGTLKGSEFIENQLRKDIIMLGLDDVPIKKIEWHLFGGADKNMIGKLELLRSTFGKDKFDFIVY